MTFSEDLRVRTDWLRIAVDQIRARVLLISSETRTFAANSDASPNDFAYNQ